MQISKSGSTNDLFMEELKKRLPVREAEKKDEKGADGEKGEPGKKEVPTEEVQLKEDRDEKDQKAEADGITEKQLPENGDRKNEDKKDEKPLPEKQLEESRKEAKAATPNTKAEGITEGRLNNASKDLYPHRNPKAHERTGEKRPINALREELGVHSDIAKRERYEKAYKGQSTEKRSIDKDPGSQLTNEKTKIKGFNLRTVKEAKDKLAQGYVLYKQATLEKMAEVESLDASMAEIMKTAQIEKRAYSNDEMAKIMALKVRKTELLKTAITMWDMKLKDKADEASRRADELTKEADSLKTIEAYQKAAYAERYASNEHGHASAVSEEEGREEQRQYHKAKQVEHNNKYNEHWKHKPKVSMW